LPDKATTAETTTPPSSAPVAAVPAVLVLALLMKQMCQTVAPECPLVLPGHLFLEQVEAAEANLVMALVMLALAAQVEAAVAEKETLVKTVLTIPVEAEVAAE
jgi:hypothetical protein